MKSLNSYSAFFPGSLVFGSGSRKEVPALFDKLCGRGGRVFGVFSNSVLQSVRGREIKELMGGRLVGYYASVPHDPPVEYVDEIIARIRKTDANAVLAVGGGSVMDSAKTASLLACGEGCTSDYLMGKLAVPTRSLPLVALPSTAGTGAEMTKNAVLSDHQNNVKKSLRSPLMVPKASVIDPALTLGLPFTVTRDSGLDALTQAIEACVSTGATRLTRAMARESVLLLMTYLEKACREGDNLEYRERVAEGSMICGLAFGQSGLGAVHGLAHPLGHLLGVAHGLSCAILLPYIMEWNLPVAEDEFAVLGGMCGVGDGAAFVSAVTQLCRRLQVPEGFGGFGLKAEHYDYIVANCRSGSMKANPRAMTDDDVRELLTRLTV